MDSKGKACLWKKDCCLSWPRILRNHLPVEEGSVNRAVAGGGKNFTGTDMGDGSSTLFWLDTWAGDKPFADSFPVLYRLERKKACERMVFDNHSYNVNWNWLSQPTTDVELLEFQRCDDVLQQFPFRQGQDRWVWAGDSKGVFNAKSLRSLISKAIVTNERYIFQWNNWVPSKVNILAWKTQLGRLP
ncbi:hypothetical protein E3N88_37733 [Mikania micrantha]|uniref:Reverse transcriptase zinc-binding domain-containing protein n=1 Tax=Mikania micrantha TaxID=192012 RepID=A0A5N6LRY0_9ASTR|nr:hypothetical protein E3N88_37733 [Mikania micrantha]